MTYHEIGIQALSPSQHSKLRNGHRVRVKLGNHHKIHVSEEQHKKIHKAHAKGSAHTIQFDPYQQEIHKSGGGWMDTLKDIGRVALPILKPIATDLAHKGLDFGINKITGSGRGRPKKHHGGALYPAGYGLHHGYHQHHAHTPKKHVGFGMHKQHKHRKGKGFLGNVLGSILPF